MLSMLVVVYAKKEHMFCNWEISSTSCLLAFWKPRSSFTTVMYKSNIFVNKLTYLSHPGQELFSYSVLMHKRDITNPGLPLQIWTSLMSTVPAADDCQANRWLNKYWGTQTYEKLRRGTLVPMEWPKTPYNISFVASNSISYRPGKSDLFIKF